MRIRILFGVSLILLLSAYSIGDASIRVGKTAMIIATPTTVVTPITPPPDTKLAEPSKPPKSVVGPSIIDIGAALANAIGTILAAIFIGLAGWLTRRFWEPLIFRRQRSPLKSGRKRRDLARYLQQERANILEVLAPGSTDLYVKDIVGGRGLFIPPLWKNLHGTTPSTELVESLITTISAGQRILLLGEPGQGKTIVLKQVFTNLVDRFLEGPRSLVPMYVPLREFTYSSGDPLESLWVPLRNRFPLSFEDFAYLVYNNQVIFLFDSFDEIKGELTQRAINDRASSGIFSHPSVLSCRRHFYDLYLSMSAIQELYSQKVELLPLVFSDTVKQYIAAFCNMKRDVAPQKTITSPEKIIETIRGNQELQDLVKRPLLLVMILDIFTDPKEVDEHEWNMAKLYQKYTEKWLQNEAAKPDSVLRQDEKATLIQEIAWSTHKKRAANPYGYYQAATFTREELSNILKRFPAFYQEKDIKFAQFIDDICLRTFLIATEGVTYNFIHKSFQEYYVARYIYDVIKHKGQDLDYITQTLQQLIPAEVEDFLKEMLDAKDLTKYDKEQMAKTLIKVYQQNSTNDDHAAVIRQNASYYLAVLGTQKAVQFLGQTYQQEPNKWVQRGMMVGLALNCRRADILEQYINIANTDPEAASINIGYHLVHYGDQALEEGYYDKGGENCAGTVRAIFRHLASGGYRTYWVLDLLTLRMLLEERGIAIFSADKDCLSFLQEFLSRDHKEQGRTFQREKKQLQKKITSTTRKLARQKE